MQVGKRLAMAEKILTEIHDADDVTLPVKEADLLASTLILLCKLELAVLKREAKEEVASLKYLPESQVPERVKEEE